MSWTPEQQRGWLLDELDSEIRNLRAFIGDKPGPERIALPKPGEDQSAIRREERANALIDVVIVFELMDPQALVEYLDSQHDIAVLERIPAYNRLMSPREDDGI